MRYEKQNLFFISDYHIGHKNIMKYDGRPFADLDEMHHELIKRWNAVVGDDDIVYYLGDLAFCRDETIKWFLSSLRGEINYIIGNHDKMRSIAKLGRFNKIYEYGTEIFIKDDDIKSARHSQGYQQIILSHYPILSWNRAHYGSFHLHGHCHGSMMKDPNYKFFYDRKVMDVGCNLLDYTPASYQQIKEVMSKKEISTHHE